MKKCTKCNIDYPIEFYNKKRDKLQTWCKNCTRGWFKDHYQKNKQYYFDKKFRYIKSNIELLNKYKDKPCMDCGINYPPYVMDFDHRENKSFNISNKIQNGLSIRTILEEIKKCDLVCSNCHRERTYKRLRNGQIGKVACL